MLIVKKFGGSSVADKERILNVAERCVEEYKKGNDVVVVLSAMGKTTDHLIDMAHDINPNPSKREMDMLLATGEQTSVALMSMAMATLGVPSVSLNAFQVAMHTSSSYGNARFKRIDSDRIRHELDNKKIVIVTGLIGGMKVFDIIYSMTSGGPGDATQTVMTVMMKKGISEGFYSTGSAFGVCFFIIVLAISAIVTKLMGKWSEAIQ